MVSYVAVCYASADVRFDAPHDATQDELRERVRERVETGNLGEVQIREVERA